MKETKHENYLVSLETNPVELGKGGQAFVPFSMFPSDSNLQPGTQVAETGAR